MDDAASQFVEIIKEVLKREHCSDVESLSDETFASLAQWLEDCRKELPAVSTEERQANGLRLLKEMETSLAELTNAPERGELTDAELEDVIRKLAEIDRASETLSLVLAAVARAERIQRDKNIVN